MAPLLVRGPVQPGNTGRYDAWGTIRNGLHGGLIFRKRLFDFDCRRGMVPAPGFIRRSRSRGGKNPGRRSSEAGIMFSQLWHTGRAGHCDSTKAQPSGQFFVISVCRIPTILESYPHGWRQPSPPPCASASPKSLALSEIYRKERRARKARWI